MHRRWSTILNAASYIMSSTNDEFIAEFRHTEAVCPSKVDSLDASIVFRLPNVPVNSNPRC